MGIEDQTAATGGEGGMDLGAAMADIEESLGFSGAGEAEQETPAGLAADNPGEDPAPAAEAAATPEPKPGETPEPAPGPDDPPKTWKEGPKAKWAALDPEIKAEIRRREDDFFRGIEGYKVDAERGRAFQQVLAPFDATLKQYGIDPLAEINNLLAAHHTLALGTQEQRVQMFKQLLGEYKVTPEELAAEAPYVDPQVASLREELKGVKSTLDARQAEEARQRQDSVRSEIVAFSQDPANVYFNEVANDMATLIRADKQLSLKDAYEKAIWANPGVRAKLLIQQEKDAAAKRETERLNRLKAAQKAARANGTGTGRSSGTAPSGTMDDTLKSTLATIRSREA